MLFKGLHCPVLAAQETEAGARELQPPPHVAPVRAPGVLPGLLASRSQIMNSGVRHTWGHILDLPFTG